MIDDLISKFIIEEVTKMTLKERMTSYLVKKKKRGTFQALQECEAMETAIIESTQNYIREWLKNELLSGKTIRNKFLEEVRDQVNLELSSKGFGDII